MSSQSLPSDPRRDRRSPGAPDARTDLPGAAGFAAASGRPPVEAGTGAGGRLPEAHGLRPVRRRPRRRAVRGRRAPLRVPRRAPGAVARPAGRTDRPGRADRGGRRAPRRPGRPLRPAVRPGRRCAASSGCSARLRTRCSSVSTPSAPTCPRRWSPPRCSARAAGSGRRWPAATATASCSSRSSPGWPRSASTASCASPATARGPGVRPGVTQVFDLDGTRLTALAAGMGLAVAVPESPDAPPVDLPPGAGGAEAAGRRAAVRAQPRERPRPAWRPSSRPPGRPARRCRSSPGSPSTPTSPRRGVLQRFPGLHLDDAVVERVLAAPDPRAGRHRRGRRRGPRAARGAGRRRGQPVRLGLQPRSRTTARRSRRRSPHGSGRGRG